MIRQFGEAAISKRLGKIAFRIYFSGLRLLICVEN